MDTNTIVALSTAIIGIITAISTAVISIIKVFQMHSDMTVSHAQIKSQLNQLSKDVKG
jgi:hypothetical protein